MQPGGRMTITTDVENYPGFADVIQGPWLVSKCRPKLKCWHGNDRRYDCRNGPCDAPLHAHRDSGDDYSCDTLIISTGARAKWLGLSEQAFQGFGVSACATCDGFFFREKTVVVVGGGNTAVEEALYLTNHATKVTLIHRRNELRAEKMLQARLLNHEKIEVLWDSVLEEVTGNTDGPMPEVTGIRVSIKTNETREIPVDGVFIAIGHSPNTELFKDQLKMDSDGLITNPDSTSTEIPGVYAAGDVQDHVFRQAVTTGTGCMAALEVKNFSRAGARQSPSGRITLFTAIKQT